MLFPDIKTQNKMVIELIYIILIQNKERQFL